MLRRKPAEYSCKPSPHSPLQDPDMSQPQPVGRVHQLIPQLLQQAREIITHVQGPGVCPPGRAGARDPVPAAPISPALPESAVALAGQPGSMSLQNQEPERSALLCAISRAASM